MKVRPRILLRNYNCDYAICLCRGTSIISRLLAPLSETPFADRVKLFAQVGALHTRCVFARRRPQSGVLEVYLSGPRKTEVGGVQNGGYMEDEGEQCTPFFAPASLVCRLVYGLVLPFRGGPSVIFLLADSFELVVLTCSVSEHIAPNLMWHISLSHTHHRDTHHRHTHTPHTHTLTLRLPPSDRLQLPVQCIMGTAESS